MPFSSISRRGVVLSIFALAGCQTTGARVNADRALTSAYDGDYTLTVGRTDNPAQSVYDASSYPGKYDRLAFLRLRVVDGRFSVVSVEEWARGTSYSNFAGAFYEGGLLELSSTVGYLMSQQKTYPLSVSAEIGDQLLNGQEITLRPQGFDQYFSAQIVIAKVG